MNGLVVKCDDPSKGTDRDSGSNLKYDKQYFFVLNNYFYFKNDIMHTCYYIREFALILLQSGFYYALIFLVS